MAQPGPPALPDLPDIRYGTLDREVLGRFVATAPEDDGPVWMVNLMHYRDRADYRDGRPDDISGREADDRYAPFGPLGAVGAELVFVADVEAQLLGATPSWDRVAVVRYPTRRAFVEMLGRPDYQELHVHKDAGMAQTILLATTPNTTPIVPDDEPSWAEVPHPPTEADGPVVVLHLLRYEDAERDEMTSYQEAAGTVAVPHGVRIAAWLGVEDTVIGDGRPWDEARFNAFPSRAAFEAVVFDPARLEAHHTHRERAVADTYTMILRPMIDRLHLSVTGAELPV